MHTSARIDFLAFVGDRSEVDSCARNSTFITNHTPQSFNNIDQVQYTTVYRTINSVCKHSTNKKSRRKECRQ